MHEDLPQLIETWKTIQQNLKRRSSTPQKILSEQDKATSILRDLLTEDFNNIVINDRNVYNDTKSYIQKIASEKGKPLLPTHANGMAHL